jgi:hypothetical protein
VRRLGLALLLVVVAAAACGDDGDSDERVEARLPDVEGVVVAVDDDELELDDSRAYEIGEGASSVSTYTLDEVPVRLDTYVHVGLDDDGRVEWIATIGIVADTDPPGITYTGTLVEVIDGRAVFADGTALKVPPDLDPDPGFVTAILDPTGVIRSLSR